MTANMTKTERETTFALLRAGWRLLTRREQIQAAMVAAFFVFASLVSALSVAALYPFLLVVSDPGAMANNPWLAQFHRLIGAPEPMSFLTILGAVTIGFLVATGVIQVAKVYILARFTEMRGHSFSYRLLSTFMAQPITFFLGRNTGDMAKGILDESREIIAMFFRPLSEFLSALVSVFLLFVVLLLISPQLTLMALALVVTVYGGLFLLLSGWLGRLGNARVAANSRRYTTSREALSGVKDIKISGTERFYLDSYRTASFEYARTRSRATMIKTMPRYVVETVAFCSVVLALLFLLDERALLAGDFLAAAIPELGVLAYGAKRMLPDVQKMYQSASAMRYGHAAVESVRRDLSLPAESLPVPKAGQSEVTLTNSLSLSGVSFSYPGSEQRALDNVSFEVGRGERVGVVGTTGAGKTTLLDVVLGLLRPQVGELAVDGRPVLDGDVRAWQQSIAYVPQHIFLADATLAENIALGEEAGGIDMKRVEQAASLAQLHELVCNELPDGYNTRIGENGVRLSGGQRQRIGIARAMYRDADLILFDEATSALDTVTESELVAAIEALPQEKTLMIIAHRLSTVRHCDRILVLSRGRLVAQGSWDENMEKCQSFRKMVEQSA